MIDKASLFHDLDFGPELASMMEYNAVLPVKTFLDHEGELAVT